MEELWRFAGMRERTKRMRRDTWDEKVRTCCETKQFRGPTSAKIPIYEVDGSEAT